MLTHPRRWPATVRDALPQGDALPPEVFDQRHRLLSAITALHAPALLLFALARGYALPHAVAEVLPIAGVWLADRMTRDRQVRALWITTGLVWSSAVLVHLSGGMIEAHFHFFIVVGFIALYQQWAPFAWAFVFTIVSHGVGSTFGPTIMFNHPSGIARPWVWAGVHGVAVATASVAQVIFWREAERHQDQLLEARTQADAAASAARESALLVMMGRRNQALLHRQLEAVERLERDTEDPEELAWLFTVDHLATRMRRNAESLMVLAGEAPSRARREPVPLADVASGAVSEVEQYARARVSVVGDVAVDGRVAPALVHLVAELLDNALSFSAPRTTVTLSGRPSADGVELEITDAGLGLDPARLGELRARVRGEVEVDPDRLRTLGLVVVGRIAAQHGIVVDLLPRTDAAGTVARVLVPSALVVDRGGWQPSSAGRATPTARPVHAVPVHAMPVDAMPVQAMPVHDEPVPDLPHDPCPARTDGVDVGGLVLPRRTPAAHLDAHLQDLDRSASSGLLGAASATTTTAEDDRRRRASGLGGLQRAAVEGRAAQARRLVESNAPRTEEEADR